MGVVWSGVEERWGSGSLKSGGGVGESGGLKSGGSGRQSVVKPYSNGTPP